MTDATRHDLEDRRVSAATDTFVADAEQARRQAHLFYRQSRFEPIEAVAAGAATVVAIVGVPRSPGTLP